MARNAILKVGQTTDLSTSVCETQCLAGCTFCLTNTALVLLFLTRWLGHAAGGAVG